MNAKSRIIVLACLAAVAVSALPLRAAEKLSDEQRQVAEKFRRLEDILLRMAELTAGTDPRRAALLKQAVARSEDRLIGLQFDTLVELLENDRLSRAMENQEGVSQDLDALLELLLSENRADRIQSEKARIRNYLKQLNEIIKRQKGIQGRTAGSGDPKRLAGEQGSLAEKTGGLAREIQDNESPDSDGHSGDEGDSGSQKSEGSGNGESQHDAQSEGSKDAEGQGDPESPSEGGEGDPSEGEPRQGDSQQGSPPSGGDPSEGESQAPGDGQPQQQPPGQGGGPSQGQGGQPQGQPPSQEEPPAGKRIEAARERMREAEEKLEEAERDGAVEKQEEAIRELEEAKAELEEILRQLREEEIERMLTALEERFGRMLRMQKAILEATERLDAVPPAERDHNHEIESSRLSTRESDVLLAADEALARLRDDGSALAFPEAVDQMREDIAQVVRRLGQAKVGQLTQTIEKDIIAALEEMIETLQKALEDLESPPPSEGQPPGQPRDPPLVDLLAEIKMIRALQLRVNRRTEQYSKLVVGEQAEAAELLELLDRLAERQERIYQVTRDLDLGRNQ